MKTSELALMAWRNLGRNRRRTLLTLISIAFGVFLAIISTAIQDRTWADMIDLAARMGGGHVTLQHPEFLEKPTLTRTVRQTARLAEVAARNGHVLRTAPRIVGQMLLSTAGKSIGAGFIAFDPAAEDSETLAVFEALVEGSIFRSSRDKGIILGDRLAKNLGLRMGKKVVYTMTDKNGEIVSGLARLSGIVRTGAPGVDRGLTLLPIDSVRRILNYAPDEAVQVAVYIDDQRRSEEVAEALMGKLGPGAQTAALPWYETQPELAGFIALKVGGAVFMELLIAFLVAAGIFNTLFVAVTERMREFGIMLAIGFSGLDIFKLVMLESLWLAMLGIAGAAAITAWPYYYLAANGIDMSAMIGEGGTEIAGVALSPIMKVGIFPEHLALIAGAAVAATLLAGLYPAWRAARVVPVETIKLV